MELTQATMVLEGGATRGVFTSGALDYLMEKNFYVSHLIGVSAGSCNAVDYVSKQPGRTRDCMIIEDKQYNYVTLKHFVRSKSLLDYDLVFDKYPNEIFPFDYDTYFTSDMHCEIVTTNCITGEAEYLTESSDRQRLMKLCRASSSMPLVSPIVNVDGVPYLDGGLADSIPLSRAMELGNEKIVLILTRNPGYRKTMPNKAVIQLYRRAYKSYPNLVHTLRMRNIRYNRVMEHIEQLEEAGKIFVLRPQIKTVSRLEQDHTKLHAFYQHGYNQMEKQYENMLAYLAK